MKGFLRGVAALLTFAVVFGAAAQDKTALSTEREKASYMIGMDVANSIAPASQDIDMPSFERAVRNAFAGGKPLVDEATAKKTHAALMARITARNGQQPGATTPVPEVSKQDVGLLIGSDVGRSLAPVKDEIDLAILLQAMRTSFAKGKLLLTDEEARAIGAEFSQKQQARLEKEAAASAGKNKQEGDAFLAKNRAVKGVFTTQSGLQYMILRQGSGMRPKPSDRVRVNYRGTLVDGTEFDSSYGDQPREFALSQVIAGWSEGLSMMPVGGKYRFWVPGALGYGERGMPGSPIGPNATLVFDVELLDVVQ